MDSLRQAQSYLERDPLRYMDMLEPIRRGMVEVTALREDGVRLYNLPGELYMLAADRGESAQALSLIHISWGPRACGGCCEKSPPCAPAGRASAWCCA